MISDRMVGTRLVTEALGAHRNGGRRRIGDLRMEADALMGRRSKRYIGRRPDRKGHVSPCDRLSV
jgi:hypothetical protein